MKKRTLPFFALALLLPVVVAPATLAGHDDEADDDAIPFSVATVYFELNDTDGDLGIHALIDGGPWKRLAIETPNRENLKIQLRGNMRQQGLTELFFESAEPSFDELSPDLFFARFPEGEYEVEGATVEGDELESSSIVTHLMPAPAENITVSGFAVPEDCDEGPVPLVGSPLIVRWDPVTHSHPDLGRTDEPIVVERYQVVVEREEPTPLKMTIDVGPGVTEVQLPPGMAGPEEEFKIEVLTRESSGNQTATESCFETE